jgi:hypothetical protein
VIDGAKFWLKAQKVGECWEWTGSRQSNGYGVLYPNGKKQPREVAHRVAYKMEVGPIPEGHVVCHRCDNPPCVRPSHLFVGTQKDNIQDCKAKGRMNPYKRHGEKNPRARLTREQVAEIRKLYVIGRYKPNQKNAPYTSKKLAKMFGVAASTIRLVTCGRNWAEVAL